MTADSREGAICVRGRLRGASDVAVAHALKPAAAGRSRHRWRTPISDPDPDPQILRVVLRLMHGCAGESIAPMRLLPLALAAIPLLLPTSVATAQDVQAPLNALVATTPQ